MRLLYFSTQSFVPVDSGAKLRDYNIARQLARHFEVTCLGFGQRGGLTPANERMEEVFDGFELVQKNRAYTPVKLLRGLAGRMPVTVLNCTTDEMMQTFRRLLDERHFDAIQFEGVHLAGYLEAARAANSRPFIAFDWHNIESELMQRYGENAANPAIGFYARATARRLAALERDILRSSDVVFVPSERERLSIAAGQTACCPVHVVENGVDTSYFSAGSLDDACVAQGIDPGQLERGSLVYVGSMDYHANIDAVIHFVTHMWPQLQAAFPQLTFKIVGRNPPPDVLALAASPNVVVTGSVPDVRPYYREAVASIVPLRVGGGTRLKILEAMSASVPVVSTRLGAEGLECTDGDDIAFAETADDFVRAIRRLLEDDAHRTALTRHARRMVEDRYDWAAIGLRLKGIYEGLAVQARKTA